MKIKWRGEINIEILNPDGTVKETKHICNEIKNTALNTMRNALAGLVTDLQIKYLAWGSDSTANAPTQTKLVAEVGRKAITSQTAGATGVMVSVCYLAASEANSPKIEELGWFAGSTASATKDSGILVARVLYSHQKTSLEALNVARTDTFAES